MISRSTMPRSTEHNLISRLWSSGYHRCLAAIMVMDCSRETILGVLLLAALLPVCHGAYSHSENVVELDPTSFSKLKDPKSGLVWLVVFYAPWCGHCKNLIGEWDKAAAALKGIVRVGALDADAHGSLAQQYGVRGFPTIKLLHTDASGALKAIDYNGGRTAQDLVQWALQQASKVALGRIGAKPSGGAGGRAGGAGGDSCGGGGGRAGGAGGGSGGGFYADTDVIELGDDNFHSQVVDDDGLWFVEFYAPWCGHCKNLKPAWIELAKALEGKVKVGAVNCDANQQTCSEFGVSGFPTLKWFGANKERPEPYEGGRDLGSLTDFANTHWAAQQPPPEVRELVDEHVWEEHCLGHKADPELELPAVKPHQLCLVAFLPHILDSKAEGRNAQIKLLQQLAHKYKARPFSYFWAEGGAQPALEANFGVGGYGYPALIAFNPSKGKYAALKSAFEERHVQDFMENVRLGFERVSDIEGQLAKVETRAPWDGSDGEEIVEDEFDLADLMGGDDDKDEL